jgi:hypothetical protein
MAAWTFKKTNNNNKKPTTWFLPETHLTDKDTCRPKMKWWEKDILRK